MKKYKYNINNLDCANCARKLEESLYNNYDFNNVVVNFNTSKLIYESEKDFTIKELNDLVKKVEPDSYIIKEEVNVKKEYHLAILILGIVICLLGYFLKIKDNVKLVLYIISYVLLLYRTFLNSIKLLIKSKTINENLLITISCLGAFFTNNVLEGAMVISLYTIGKILEEKAINNSRRSIKDLLDIKQSYANLKKGNTTSKIDVEDIKINDLLIVKKGEKIPVDGVIVKGSTYLDMSSLTGESALVNVDEKSNVLSGSINVSDVITIKATSLFEDSTVNKIIELLENATDKKTKTENGSQRKKEKTRRKTMKNKVAVSLVGVHTHTHTHTLCLENKIIKEINEENRKTKYQMEYHENSGSRFSKCNFSWSGAFMVAGI